MKDGLMNDKNQPKLREAAERMLDSAGVPDADVRRIYLELAELIESPNTEAGVVAIAVGIFRLLGDSLRDYYRPQDPGDVELEYLSSAMEYFERTGRMLPSLEQSGAPGPGTKVTVNLGDAGWLTITLGPEIPSTMPGSPLGHADDGGPH
jgi:hypothetical protein